MPNLIPEQLKAQVSRWRSRKGWENERIFAIRTDFPYEGIKDIDCDGLVVEVADCRSDLEARELLTSLNRENGKGLLLLMRSDESKLGEDVRAWFAGKALQTLDQREVLKEIYQATAIDPRIANDDSLLEAMVMAGSAGIGRKAPGGALDLDFAWSVILKQPDLMNRRPDLVEILEWSLDEPRWAAVRGLGEDLVPSFFSWVGERAGGVSRCLETLFTSDQAGLYLPLGLVVGDLFHERLNEVDGAKDARIRIENYLNGKTVSTSEAAAWSQAARDVIRKRSIKERERLAGKVDEILTGIRAMDLAYAFDFSKQGFRDRWLRFAEDIDRLAKRKWETGSRAVYNSLSQLRDHGLAPLHDSRLKRAEMAARLAAYEANEPVATEDRGSLVKAAASFAAVDSFVDWARFNLAWGDSQPEVAEVYGRLARRRAKARIEEQVALGDRLRHWHADNEKGSIGLVPIENAVATWVAPVAEQHPVLLLVMDGMSYPAFHQLSRSFVGAGWLPQQKDGQVFPSSVLSVLPSVTERSRWALFSGKIEAGSRKGEEVAFREHPALSDLRSRGKPLLFKKGDLGSEDSAALSPKVRDILAGNEHRVVAVVINAIDDQLKTSGQLSVDWAIHHIGILPSILEAADQGNRLIVLTSDHGHIPEMENTKPIETSSDGEARFRFGEPSDENERLFTGKRIEAATGGRPVVLPLTETIRYGSKTAGYHGGACDLEVLVPLAVFTPPGFEIDGFGVADLPEPAWWDWERYYLGEGISAPVAIPVKPKTRKKVEHVDELPLFEGLASSEESAGKEGAAWLGAFFQSAVFAEQKQLLGRAGPSDDHLRRVLSALDASGGSLLQNALAQSIGEPVVRISGIVSRVARFTNVDSYEILEIDRDSSTIRLNRKLLASQFQIKI